MEFTAEQLEKAKQTKSVEELLALAKENGVELTEEEAESFIARWHKEGELADDELNNVSGGCGGSSDPDPLYKKGQHLWIGYQTTQNYLEIVVDKPEFYCEGDGWRYLVSPVGYGFQQSEYLETRQYVHTTKPGPGWND